MPRHVQPSTEVIEPYIRSARVCEEDPLDLQRAHRFILEERTDDSTVIEVHHAESPTVLTVLTVLAVYAVLAVLAVFAVFAAWRGRRGVALGVLGGGALGAVVQPLSKDEDTPCTHHMGGHG